ncbi:hypothetical protein [Sinosporangium siamense]|uniref:hypothetical protein n=1 Tax=Sinosporangium siamense TaxID=1367973 RepID=UPI00194F2C0E|nr:hypothetical protein [Sinosporangium siamense]
MSIKGGPGDGAKLQAAQQKCSPILAQVLGEGVGRMDAGEHDRLVRYAQCMREDGIPMKDPTTNGQVQLNVPPCTPESTVKRAAETCKQHAPEIPTPP